MPTLNVTDRSFCLFPFDCFERACLLKRVIWALHQIHMWIKSTVFGELFIRCVRWGDQTIVTLNININICGSRGAVIFLFLLSQFHLLIIPLVATVYSVSTSEDGSVFQTCRGVLLWSCAWWPLPTLQLKRQGPSWGRSLTPESLESWKRWDKIHTCKNSIVHLSPDIFNSVQVMLAVAI